MLSKLFHCNRLNSQASVEKIYMSDKSDFFLYKINIQIVRLWMCLMIKYTSIAPLSKQADLEDYSLITILDLKSNWIVHANSK